MVGKIEYGSILNLEKTGNFNEAQRNEEHFILFLLYFFFSFSFIFLFFPLSFFFLIFFLFPHFSFILLLRISCNIVLYSAILRD